MADASATITYTTLLSSVLNNTRRTRYDNIFKKSAFWAKMHANGRKVLDEGGAKIQRTVVKDTNKTVKSYEGYETIDTTPQESDTVLLEDWREVAGTVTISRREERINSGPSQIYNLLESKIDNLDRSFAQKMNEMLLAPSGASLAIGNGGKDIVPLTTVIAESATTLHGLAEATHTYWVPQRAASASVGGVATSYADFKQELRHMYNLCGRNNDGFPDLVLTSQEGYEKYEESLEGQVRYGSTEMANLGFETIRLKGAEVMWDQICPRQTDSGGAMLLWNASTVDEHVFYFINTDFLTLVVDKETDLVNEDFVSPINQTAKTAKVLFMGNLICTNRRTQGILDSVDVGSIPS